MDSGTLAAVIGFGAAILFCVILGAAFMRGHGGSLLAGLNTMSEQERARWNVPAILHFAGKAMLLFAAMLGVCLAGILLDSYALNLAGILLAFGVIFGMAVIINTSPRFRN